MSVLLFRLNQVPEDEAQEVRDLLTQYRVDYYETSAGLLGISNAGLWLKDDSDYDRAKALLDDYQQQRYRDAREHYEALKARGEHPTLWRNFRANPMRFVIYCSVAVILIYFVTIPFFYLVD